MAEIYHVLNRSIDKRKIFLDKQDYFRFIHDLFEFNNQEPIETSFYYFQKAQNNDLQGRNIRKPRKLLVDIHAFCIMPNHYHLLLSSKIDNGIPWFMQKLGAGYVKYFNQKHKRKGTLFEGRYKSIYVEKEAHWSSHLDYLGKKNFPSVTNREFLLDVFGGTEKYEDSIKNWLKDLEIDRIRDFLLE